MGRVVVSSVGVGGLTYTSGTVDTEIALSSRDDMLLQGDFSSSRICSSFFGVFKTLSIILKLLRTETPIIIFFDYLPLEFFSESFATVTASASCPSLILGVSKVGTKAAVTDDAKLL